MGMGRPMPGHARTVEGGDERLSQLIAELFADECGGLHADQAEPLSSSSQIIGVETWESMFERL